MLSFLVNEEKHCILIDYYMNNQIFKVKNLRAMECYNRNFLLRTSYVPTRLMNESIDCILESKQIQIVFMKI